ncbi:15837_t:CDS:2, partial [Racocetra persica]
MHISKQWSNRKTNLNQDKEEEIYLPCLIKTEKGLAYTPNWKEDIRRPKDNLRNTSPYKNLDSKEDENYLLKIECEELYSYPTYPATNNTNTIKTRTANSQFYKLQKESNNKTLEAQCAVWIEKVEQLQSLTSATKPTKGSVKNLLFQGCGSDKDREIKGTNKVYQNKDKGKNIIKPIVTLVGIILLLFLCITMASIGIPHFPSRNVINQVPNNV